MKKNTTCQSCMMPLKKDPKGGGTNADGSISEKYCSYCYQNGQFTQDFTMEEMRVFCIDTLVKMKWPRFLAKWAMMGLPKLERWRA